MSEISVPTLERCVNNGKNCKCGGNGYTENKEECKLCGAYYLKIISLRCNRIFKKMSYEEKYDTIIDIFIHTIKKYDGRSKFQTLLYIIAPQIAKKRFDKILKSKKIRYTSKNIILEKSHIPIKDLQEIVPSKYYDIAYNKYYLNLTNDEISKKYNISLCKVDKMLEKLHLYIKQKWSINS